MRDHPLNKTDGRRSAAIASVDDFVAGIPTGERLPAEVLERYDKRGFRLGWRVSIDFSDGIRRELHLLADNSFPYVTLRIALADEPEILTWPHLEKDGLLCILPSDATVSGENPAGVAEYVLGEACRLIEECIGGENRDDFRTEFLSYWELATDTDVVRFISLVDPHGPARRIVIWRGQGVTVAGDNRTSLTSWLSRWGPTTGSGRRYNLHDGLLIWLPEPLLPAEYPHTAADVRALAREKTPTALDILEGLAVSEVDEIDVLLGAPTRNGTCFGAVTVRHCERGGRFARKRNLLEAGFRPGHVPPRLLVSRYFSNDAKVTKASVERADHEWIHGRDQDRRQSTLRKRRVAVLGCGSVGGPLVRLLAQAGIGNLLLVDPDRMDWPNISRHELGATSVRCNKANEMAREIARDFPHLGEISARSRRLAPHETALVREMASCDLIVSTTGNWAAESFLNDVLQETLEYPPILFGWVEPHAAAAHAVLVMQGDACLRCGVNDKGRPHLTVTDWTLGSETRQAPVCGGAFTPYGPAELCWAHALIAECAIDTLTENLTVSTHRVWIGSLRHVEASGGTWSPKWMSEIGDPGTGGRRLERRWPVSRSCPVCRRRERVA